MKRGLASAASDTIAAVIDREMIQTALRDLEALGDELGSGTEEGAVVARLRALDVEPYGAMEAVLGWVGSEDGRGVLGAAVLEGLVVGLWLARRERSG